MKEDPGNPQKSLTFNHSAQQPWDGLHLCHIVHGKVWVTGCIEIFTITEDAPQISGHRRVFYDLSLGTRFKIVILKSSVS